MDAGRSRFDVRKGVRQYLRQSLVTGLAITVPLLVTMVVLFFALGFLTDALNPLAVLLRKSLPLGQPQTRLLFQVLSIVVLLVIIVIVGALAESQYGSGRIESRVDSFMTSIPGLGSIYESLDEMSRILMSRDKESFQEVKLVEYPGEGSYTLAFQTAEPGQAVLDATGHEEMVTVFMPMAPNPFMGGFVIHIAADRVYDVDMTIEEGVQAIVSSGIAVDQDADAAAVDSTSREQGGESIGG